MIDFALLAVFIPTFFFVSITPGLCMTLAMTLGMTLGLKRTLWMMTGELLGVGLVSMAAVLGVAAMMIKYPEAFWVLKYGGGAYLGYLGVELWRSRGRMAFQEGTSAMGNISRLGLASQGFITAVSNPKAWAFMVALLPPFVDADLPMVPQLSILIIMILFIEFWCLVLYASGGRALRRFLEKSGNVRMLNRVAGTLMIGVGAWLALS
ncbi:MAG: LysE family translocator [Rhodospirillaceae bacterium]|nr:LysE family translocator [Rhodospirillaceae bacterium]